MADSSARYVVAVDGGGSKTDAVLLNLEGELIAHARRGGSSPQVEGLAESVETVDSAVQAVLAGIDPSALVQVSLYLSGLDLPQEIEDYRAAVAGLPWAGSNLVLDNDLFALLRAGSDAPNAVAIVVGTGMNAIGLRADGETYRFTALGGISGDWGGGGSLGSDVLWHAARAEDGRGPQTLLVDALLAATGASSVAEVTEDIHFGRRAYGSLSSLSPLMMATAAAGDAVAISVVKRQADEIVAYARASIGRLDMAGEAVQVVIGGGVARSRDPLLLARTRAGLAETAARAELVVVDAPPVLGAGLLALADAGADAAVLAQARVALGAVRP
ncbi:N-acetylglucosamine kinase [Mycetocola tolaasinivorans]|uniref:N-acetylglucosamine kinase n=1 Tax=Mycetocola tolaasinivorans TaxID=76635 RepID=A0A3L7AC98_9MICO|nr:N-acetylglucosamine kinase [Mycetocola tolaasinivorans]